MCQAAAEMGIDNLEHGFFWCLGGMSGSLDVTGLRAEALVRVLLEKHVALTETPGVWSEAVAAVTRPLLDPSVRERFSRFLVAPSPAPPPAPDGQPHPYARLLMTFVKAGGRVVLGSDSGSSPRGAGTRLAGLADHGAIERFVSLGIPPLDTIRMATLNGAMFLDIQDRTGSIQTGKEADLLVVRGNPAERIGDIENIEMVFSNGVAYDPKTLIEDVKGQVGWK
jgi:hypothetical protein